MRQGLRDQGLRDSGFFRIDRLHQSAEEPANVVAEMFRGVKVRGNSETNLPGDENLRFNFTSRPSSVAEKQKILALRRPAVAFSNIACDGNGRPSHLVCKAEAL
jgi:hypothetical protein